MTTDQPSSGGPWAWVRGRIIPLTLIGVFLGFYAAWAGSAIRTLSPTPDEPLHAIGAWYAHFRSDYRPDREDPPLWLHYVGMFLDKDDIKVLYPPEAWAESGHGANTQEAYFYTLYYRGGADIPAMVKKARVPMFLVSLAFGLVLAASAWWIATLHAGERAGAVAGVAAAGLFALEPLILGHGVLVKNDIAFAMCFYLVGLAAYAVTRAVTPWRVAGLAVACGVAMNVKFSGLLLIVAVVPVVLGVRALMPGAWRFMGRELKGRAGRMGVAVGVWGVAVLTTWAMCWACYSFRFRPEPGDARFDMNAVVKRTAAIDLAGRYALRNPGADLNVDPAEAATWKPPTFVYAMLFAHAHQLLPESMCAGLIYTYSSTLHRPTFLMGAYSDTGFRSYFPLAYVFKTPLTILGLLGVAGVVAARQRGAWRYGLLFVPAGIYLASAVSTRLNIGLRHFSPMYPFVILAIALTLAWLWQRYSSRGARSVVIMVLVVLAVEVVPHRLRYIQFFNLAAGGEAGGLRLLSDSNLDWGQDLYRLVEWQRENPGERLALIYFGGADPRAAGLRYQNAPGSQAPGVSRPPPPGSVVAVSATQLQGTYLLNDLRTEMAKYRAMKPIAVLGGTFYLYKLP